MADDFKTTGGKEYKGATVSRVEPDGIVLRTKSGIVKVYFVELPKEVQERFGYDPAALQKREESRQKQAQQKTAVSQPDAQQKTAVSQPDSFADALAKLQKEGLLRLDCSEPDARAWINPLLWATNDARWKENVTHNLAAYCHPKYPSIYILDAESGRELASYGPFDGSKAK